MRTSLKTAALTGAILCTALLGLGACSDFNWPFHRAQSKIDAAPSEGGSDNECADIRSQMRAAQESRREAPTTTTNPEIMEAAEAKADKRVEDLRQRYEALDCPEEANVEPGRQPPLQPAPGAINR